MEQIGAIMMIVGSIISFIGGVRLIIRAFRTNFRWGLFELFIPPVLLVYSLFNWDDAKGPLSNYLVGVVLIIVGMMVTGT